MKISERMTITKRTVDGAFYGERDSASYIIDRTHKDYPIFDRFYDLFRSTPYAAREELFYQLVKDGMFPEVLTMKFSEEERKPQEKPVERSAQEILQGGIQHLMDFFTEFSFVPSFRFVNTFAFMACTGRREAIDYVNSYFALMDSSYAKEVEQKVASKEFSQIISDIAQYGKPSKIINTRLKVYFGPQGTGKTTVAQEEAENRCIVCNSSMLPSDLMEDFIFRDGNPDFNPSLLWDCMEQGKKIVLDEINLLPFDSLRFLQGLVDGKTEFYYKNRPVHIKEGFQIIGTMNLTLGGMTYGLPEPLVDRCSEAKEFKLTAEQLTKAITGWNE